MGDLEADLKFLRDYSLETKVRERAYAYLAGIIIRCKVIDIYSLAERLEEAEDGGIITEEESLSALNIDLLAEGFLKDDKERKVLVAVEVSVEPDIEDVKNAKERSKIIEKAFGFPVIPVVIGETFTKGVKNKAKELEVMLISTK